MQGFLFSHPMPAADFVLRMPVTRVLARMGTNNGRTPGVPFGSGIRARRWYAEFLTTQAVQACTAPRNFTISIVVTHVHI